jgi:autotransporter-associated beta strand protein
MTLAIGQGLARAGTITWTGAVDANWDTSTANWSGTATVYADGDQVTLDDTASGTTTVTVVGGVSPGSTTVNNSTKTYSIGGAAIGGSGGLVKSGTGVLTLSGSNTYTGATTISAGTLKLGNANALGATGTGNGTVIQSGAALDVNGAYVSASSNEAITVSGAGVDGLGAIINSGTVFYNRGFGDLTLAGNTTIGGANRWDLHSGASFYGNNYTLTKAGSFQIAVSRAINNAEILLTAGRITIQTGDALGGTTFGNTTVSPGATLAAYGSYTVPERIIFNGGALDQENPATTTYSGNVTLNANISVSAGTGAGIVLSGFVDGSGGFTKSGAGTLGVNGNNTYGGVTTISGGTVRLGHQNALGRPTSGNTSTVVQSGATLDLNSITGGSLSGGTEIVTISGTGVGGLGALVNNGSTDIYWGVDQLVINGSATIGGTRRWDIRSQYIRSADANPATLTKTGTNYIAVSLSNTQGGSGYGGLGDINLNQGTLSFEASNAVGLAANNLTVASGATLQFWTPGSITNTKSFVSNGGMIVGANGTSTLGGTIVLNADTTFSGGFNLVANATVSGSGSLIKSGTGTLTLNAANPYQGNTTIQGGTLKLGAAGSFANSPGISVANGAFLDLTAKPSGFAFGAGQTLGGRGTVLLPGAQSVVLGGILAPGDSAGILTFSGAGVLDIQSAAGLQFELGNPADQVLLTNGAALNIGSGLLEFQDFAFTPITGFGLGSYTLFETSQAIVGTLGSNVSGLAGGLNASLAISADGTDLLLNVVPEPSAWLLASLALVAAVPLARRGRRGH